MTQNRPLRIFIIEDHHLVRQCLSMTLARRPGFEVVGEAENAQEGVPKVGELSPDIVVIDTHLPDRSGIEASREIRARYPDVKVLLLTAHGDDRAVVCSVLAGAAGYLLKEVRSQEIINALRKAGQGQSLLEPSMTRRILERMRGGIGEDEERQLTPVEHQILELITQGKTNAEIAPEVSLDESAVRDHIAALHRKLEVIRRTQSVTYSVTWRSRQGIG